MHRVIIAPKGSIRRWMESTRKYRTPGNQSVSSNTAEEARLQNAARIPEYTVDAGRQELAGYHEAARARSQRPR